MNTTRATRHGKILCIVAFLFSLAFPCARLCRADSPINQQIIVDQFGWRPDATKLVFFADPVIGQNRSHRYKPGNTFEVHNAADDQAVFHGPVVPWHDGALDDVSGDRVWTGDFSELTKPGKYYIYDPTNHVRSFSFRIDAAIYNDVLKAAVRMYYYQRTGTAIPEKFGGNWHHAVDHIGPRQDTQCHLWRNGRPAPNGQVRDLSGGWFDAGDYNKYIPFTSSDIWELLSAYEWNPDAFGDDWNIPESGNGVPDILDETKYELDFLLKMQNPDGSVLNRVSNATYDAGHWDPATDTQPRYYTRSTTWATGSFAANIAHAARVYAKFDLVYPGYSDKLKNAALKAWDYLQKNPRMTPASGTDEGDGLKSADASGSPGLDLRVRIWAAAELFKTTGYKTFARFYESNYEKPAAADNGMQPLTGDWPHFDASGALELNYAAFTYATTPGARDDIVSRIKTAVANTADEVVVTPYDKQTDAYRAYMITGQYCWGSNQIKSRWGDLPLFAVAMKLNPDQTAKYRQVSEQYLHYFFGQNPLAMVYLSNMGSHGANLGAQICPLRVYHSWFGNGSDLYDGINSRYGPPPGYLVGGPNRAYEAEKRVKSPSPPAHEPPEKSYLDFNVAWPLDSWSVTEPDLGYQSAFVLLLSQYCTAESH